MVDRSNFGVNTTTFEAGKGGVGQDGGGGYRRVGERARPLER